MRPISVNMSSGRDIGEEPEAAEVHADEGDPKRRQMARHVQQGAVAADDHGEVDVLADGVQAVTGFRRNPSS